MSGTSICETAEGGAAYRGLLALACVALGSLGFAWASFAILLADLSRALNLSPGPLGLALAGGMVASLPVMVLAGRFTDRAGSRPLLVVSAVLMGVGFASLSFVGSSASLLSSLLLLSAASGAYDVGANAAAMDYERATGLKRMTLIHSAFSAGGALGALSAGSFLSTGVGFRLVYLATLVPLGVVAFGAAKVRFPRVEGPQISRGGTSSGLYGNGPLLLVALVAALAFLSEAAMEHWSGIYLRNPLALPALVGASGVAVYHASMAAGRLICAGVIGRFGNRLTLRVAGLLSAGGMALALATTEPGLVVLGFLVVGLCLSAVAPIALSLAGDMFPDRAGSASSVVTTLGYGGFLLGPILVGVTAELLSLRVALGVVGLAGSLIFFLAHRPYMDQPGARNSQGSPPVVTGFGSYPGSSRHKRAGRGTSRPWSRSSRI